MPPDCGLTRAYRVQARYFLSTCRSQNDPEYPDRICATPVQPVSPKRRRYGGASGGKFCSVNENHLIAQLLTREFESNPGSHINQSVIEIV